MWITSSNLPYQQHQVPYNGHRTASTDRDVPPGGKFEFILDKLIIPEGVTHIITEETKDIFVSALETTDNVTVLYGKNSNTSEQLAQVKTKDGGDVDSHCTTILSNGKNQEQVIDLVDTALRMIYNNIEYSGKIALRVKC